jgi:L-iditol 2-dehydrogenase
MKAMALTGIRQMKCVEVPAPRIQHDNDVLIRLARVGVCGSDVHYYETGRIGSQVVDYPFVVGHECAGIVADVGAGVRRLHRGDRVAIDPAMSCFQCDQCRAGRHHTCRKLKFLGCPGQADGCLSEFIVMPDTCCFRIPDRMTLDQAALSEPLAIGVYAVRRSIPMMPQVRVGILGAGPIGLSCMFAAKAAGARMIYMTDLLDDRINFARRCGVSWAGHGTTPDPIPLIQERDPLQLDVIFECCGKQEALDQAIEMLKPGGTLMIVGIPTVDRVSFSIDQMRRKEITVRNVRRQVDCVQATLDMIAGGTVNVDLLATHRFPFHETPKAFEVVANYADGVIKAMIDFDIPD